jgi:hypothetical protein
MLGATALALSVAQAFADDDVSRVQLPTGQFVTPTALPGAVQQFLNPGLANYPDFVANEAVRAQLSPDGDTLLVLCAGYNSNLDKNANVDLAASNQYIFVYDVAGQPKKNPSLRQVIQQTNAYIGLVWAPNGKTFYATGGNDDAVYQYAQTGGSWSQSAKILLGHLPANGGMGGLGSPRMAGRWSSPTTTTTRSA